MSVASERSTPRRGGNNNSSWSLDEPNKLLQAKNARKRAEADVQLLSNRLQRLQMEEAKARAKIEETQRRAQEIMILKSRNDHYARAKDSAREYASKVLKEETKKNYERNQQRKQQIRQTKASIEKQRREEAAAMKREMKENRLAIQQYREQQRLVNAQAKEAIRKHELELRRKSQMEKEANVQSLNQDYERRIMKEEQMLMGAEGKVKMMEAEENRLIEALKKTQELQKSAYENLEEALGSK